MATDKKEYRRSKYVDNIKNYREVYEKRKAFLKEWAVPGYEKEMETTDGGTTPPSDGQGSDVSDNTDGAGMNPTVDAKDLICPCEKGTYRFTSAYGSRWGRLHGGIDLAPKVAGDRNCKFYSIGDGVVVDAKKGGVSGFGTWIIIKHRENLYSLYGHFPPDTLQVKTGQQVKKGQYLAKMGMEGRSTGVHLHFEISTEYPNRKPTRQDPEKYIEVRSGATALPTSRLVDECCSSTRDIKTDEGAPMHGDYEDCETVVDEESRRVLKMNQRNYSYNETQRIGKIISHKQTRELFLEDRILWARSTKCSKMVKLDKEKFIHLGYDGFDGNMYSKDAAEIFTDLLLKSKLPYFKIVSGYRKSEQGRISPHEAGCAIDIQVEDIDEARELADCAWQLGIRAIAFGGNFEQKNAYVHIDIAPTEKRWSYGTLPVYNGPGNWIYNI